MHVTRGGLLQYYLFSLFEALDNLGFDAVAEARFNVGPAFAALSGLVDGNVASPVIACPPYSDRFSGADVFSSLRMPSGIAPLVVLDPGGAALATAKILGIGDPAIRTAVESAQQAWTQTIIDDDQAIERD